MAVNSQCYVSALYDYTYNDNDGRTISIKQGEQYILLEKSNIDWWHVQNAATNEQLYVPASYVEEEKQNAISVGNDNVTRINLGPSSPPVKSRGKKYQAPLPPTQVQGDCKEVVSPRPDYDESPNGDKFQEVDTQENIDPAPDYITSQQELPARDHSHQRNSDPPRETYQAPHMESFRPTSMINNSSEYESPEYANLRDIKTYMGIHPPENLQRACLDSAENWEKQTDQNTGQVYYYNVVTRQTSWTMPEPDSGPASPQTPLESPPARERPKLVRGYSQEQEQTGETFYVNSTTNEKWYCSTDDQGTTYYYNASGDTRWELPQTEFDRRNTHNGVLSGRPNSVEWRRNRVGSLDEMLALRNALPTVTENRSSTLPANLAENRSSTLPANLAASVSGDHDTTTKRGTEIVKRESVKRASSPPVQIRNLKGYLNKAKVLENGKKVKKNWNDTYCLLNSTQLIFYKDKKASVGSQKSPLGKAESVIDLRTAKVEWGGREKSSKKHVVQVSSLGSQYLLQSDDPIKIHEWYLSLSGIVAQFNTQNIPHYETPDESNLSGDPQDDTQVNQRPARGRHSKSTKKETYTIYEDPSLDTLEKKSRIRARLRDLIRKRPTMETLEKQGILLEERVFGAHLLHLCERERSTVPIFVMKCIAAIEHRGLDIDGIYRVSGNLAQVQKLRFLVDENDSYDLERTEFGSDVHVLTGSLKLFFRELREPLFPFNFFERFLVAIKLPERMSKLQAFQGLISVLPKPNHDTLKILCRHLTNVCAHKDKNRMALSNLAIVFGPTLMWPEKESPNMAVSMMYQNSIVEFLLLEYDNLF